MATCEKKIVNPDKIRKVDLSCIESIRLLPKYLGLTGQIPMVNGDEVIYVDLSSYIPVIPPIFTPTRSTVNLVTGTINEGEEDIGVVTLGKTFILTKINVNQDCRITLYKTSAARTADAGRVFGDRSYIGTAHGIICDILLNSTTGTSWQCSPDIVGTNGDTIPSDDIYYRIENLSPLTKNVSVDFIKIIEEV